MKKVAPEPANGPVATRLLLRRANTVRPIQVKRDLGTYWHGLGVGRKANSLSVDPQPEEDQPCCNQHRGQSSNFISAHSGLENLLAWTSRVWHNCMLAGHAQAQRKPAPQGMQTTSSGHGCTITL